MSITRTALRQGSGQVVLFYANRDESSVIFASELPRSPRSTPTGSWSCTGSSPSRGCPRQEHMRAFASPFTSYDAFVCGPAPFMKASVQALQDLGFPASAGTRRSSSRSAATRSATRRSRTPPREADPTRTGPGAGSPVPEPATLVGDLDGEAFEFDDWPPGSRSSSTCVDKGFKAPYSCREGECSACACRLLEGEVKMINNDVLDEEDLADGIRLACQSLPVTDSVRITYE